MEKTFEWFGTKGVHMRQTGDAREYSGVIEGLDNTELVLLSAGEIPRELAAGRIHLGVTGSDLVRDKHMLDAVSNTSRAMLATARPAALAIMQRWLAMPEAFSQV